MTWSIKDIDRSSCRWWQDDSRLGWSKIVKESVFTKHLLPDRRRFHGGGGDGIGSRSRRSDVLAESVDLARGGYSDKLVLEVGDFEKWDCDGGSLGDGARWVVDVDGGVFGSTGGGGE